MDAFVQVATNQNFLAAASELGISAGMVTRRVQRLEKDLGVRLINRTTRRLNLTDAGRRYYEFSKRVLHDIRQEENAIRQSRDVPAGRISVAAPTSFGVMEMGTAITSFMVEYPKIQVTLIIGGSRARRSDQADYQTDIFVRISRTLDTNLYACKIGTVRWLLCASRSYLKKAGSPRALSELIQHSCLLTSQPFTNGAWRFNGPDGSQTVRVSGVVSPSNAITMRYMALAGAGIALLPDYCVAADIAARRLVHVLPEFSVPSKPICAYYSDAPHQPLATRLLLKFLQDRFRNAAWSKEE
jgi:DNA-binding transcriptional LysR family regulator